MDMVCVSKIIVLDDDPTGSQTVHSCLLLMEWDIETIRLGLRDKSSLYHNEYASINFRRSEKNYSTSLS